MVQLTERDNTTIQELESRMGLYRLFRRLFEREVDQVFISQIASSSLKDLMVLLDINLPEVGKELDSHLEELACEFAYLFIGPGPHISPYESVQAEGEGKLNGRLATEVNKFILLAGFDFKEGNKRSPDHIASEFEFMEYLIQHQISSLRNDDTEEAEKSFMLQQEFLRLHLSNWISPFCERIIDAATLDFYKSVAQATAEFILSEQEALNITR